MSTTYVISLPGDEATREAAAPGRRAEVRTAETAEQLTGAGDAS